jgi:hypothetical protein
MERKKGYYWVRVNETWHIACWGGKTWDIHQHVLVRDDDLTEIDERQISHEVSECTKPAVEILMNNLIGVNKLSVKAHHDFLPSILRAMEEYRKQGRFFTEEEIEAIKETAYENGYNTGRDAFT